MAGRGELTSSDFLDVFRHQMTGDISLNLSLNGAFLFILYTMGQFLYHRFMGTG
jgi:hypothetical protein